LYFFRQMFVLKREASSASKKDVRKRRYQWVQGAGWANENIKLTCMYDELDVCHVCHVTQVAGVYGTWYIFM
jgi:hypothetical protein